MSHTFRNSRPAPRYPFGTLVPYGPDDSLATKLVVSVLQRPSRREPSAMRTWITQGVDVRNDPVVAAEVAEFLRQHKVRESVSAERILGCPHEEGVDYPMGRVCPRCPFWATIDRFTHQPAEPPAPSLSREAVLAELSADRTDQPIEALDCADAHRDALVEPLLAAIDRGLADPADVPETDANLFCYGLYLFAKWRETRAYPFVLRWLSLPGEGAFEIAGDIVTEAGPRILAAVCDGDLKPIQSLVMTRSVNEYCRGLAVNALALLAAWTEVPREPIVDYFSWLAREGLEREPCEAWNSLAAACIDIEATEVLPILRRAYDEGLIATTFMSRSELDAAERWPPGRMLEDTRERYPPIDDVAEATRWWSAFERRPALAPEFSVASEPYRAPPKVGRNDPCPCGSGKKYKKCCGG